MAEIITLTTPFTVDPRQATAFTIFSLQLNWRDKVITILLGQSGVEKQVVYRDTAATVDAQGNPVAANPAATNMMVALNKANLSTKSLHKRIMEQLVTDGHIAGTISGTPD